MKRRSAVHMRTKRKKKRTIIELLVIAMLLCCFALLSNLTSNQAPSTSAERLQAGRDCYAEGDWSAAIQHLRVYCQAESGNPEAYILLGDCYAEQGKFQQANEAYRQAASLQPSEANTLNENQRMLELTSDIDSISIRIEAIFAIRAI